MKRHIENNLCPRCGGELVLRKGKMVSFIDAQIIQNINLPKTFSIYL